MADTWIKSVRVRSISSLTALALLSACATQAPLTPQPKVIAPPAPPALEMPRPTRYPCLVEEPTALWEPMGDMEWKITFSQTTVLAINRSDRRDPRGITMKQQRQLECAVDHRLKQEGACPNDDWFFTMPEGQPWVNLDDGRLVVTGSCRPIPSTGTP